MNQSTKRRANFFHQALNQISKIMKNTEIISQHDHETLPLSFQLYHLFKSFIWPRFIDVSWLLSVSLKLLPEDGKNQESA